MAMSLWDSLQRVIAQATNSFESVLNSVSNLISGEGQAANDDPCKLKSVGQQVAFTIAVIGLGAKMAKADGHVSQAEITAFREVFQVPPGEERNVRRVFDIARQDVAGFESHAKRIAKLFQGCPQVLSDLMDGLFHIAKADGTVHDAEIVFLARVAEIFGFKETQFEKIRCTHMSCPTSDPYSILGVDPSATDADLRRHYLRLVKENHPDSLVARGVPEEFILMANAKLAVINTAFEQIRAQRDAELVTA